MPEVDLSLIVIRISKEIFDIKSVDVEFEPDPEIPVRVIVKTKKKVEDYIEKKLEWHRRVKEELDGTDIPLSIIEPE